MRDRLHSSNAATPPEQSYQSDDKNANFNCGRAESMSRDIMFAIYLRERAARAGGARTALGWETANYE